MISRRTLVSNSISLLANRLAQSISAFAVVALIARMLGPHELGQSMLAFSFYFVAMTIASQGFKTLFTREMAKKRSLAGAYLTSGSALQLGCALIAYGLLLALVAALPYAADTTAVCAIFGLCLIPFALSNVTESVFQAFDRMYLIAYSTAPIYFLRVGLIWLALQNGHGIESICWIMVAAEVVVLGVEWLFVLSFVQPARRIDTGFMLSQVSKAKALLGIEGMSVVRSRMQMLVLSVMGGEALVGLYGAMMQLLQPFLIASQSMVAAVFPSMVKTAGLGLEHQKKLAAGIIEILLLVSIPLVIALAWVGDRILVLVYSDESFANAATPLTIVAIGLLASSFNRALSFVLVANGYERINLREVIVSTILTTVLSVSLVHYYGLMGAAVTGPIAATVALAQYGHAVHRHLFQLDYLRILIRPILAGIAMQLLLYVLTRTGQNIFVIMGVTAMPFAIGVIWYLFPRRRGTLVAASPV